MSAKHKFYLPVGFKLLLTQLLAFAWVSFSWYLALPWIQDLARYVPYWVATGIVLGIAIVPGYAFAFIFFSLAFDRRPGLAAVAAYPPLTILVAAYNEQESISATIDTLIRQKYPGVLEIIVIDDGSTDYTGSILAAMDVPNLKVIDLPRNGGKAKALNAGLRSATHELIVTVDADTFLHTDALQLIVRRYLSDPPGTVAVAGAIDVQNSRASWLTKVQEWDYFHGIAVVKRTQSLYQGTLVAQGAFSLYARSALNEVHGWPETVGEDIVMSWALLKRGYRIGYAEDAVAFTNVPETYPAFYRQRRRWARGLIEAFKYHPEILLKFRLNTPFFYLNVLYPVLDAIYLLCFMPGLIAALFGYYFIAGPMTLAVLPLGLANNLLMFRVQGRMFASQSLRVRRNLLGFILYLLFAQMVMAPAAVAGYLAEFLSLRKTWGTK